MVLLSRLTLRQNCSSPGYIVGIHLAKQRFSVPFLIVSVTVRLVCPREVPGAVYACCPSALLVLLFTFPWTINSKFIMLLTVISSEYNAFVTSHTAAHEFWMIYKGEWDLSEFGRLISRVWHGRNSHFQMSLRRTAARWLRSQTGF